MNVIYCRYSPRPEGAAERSVSLQVQLEACQKYCDANEMAVDKVISNPEVSARKVPFFERQGSEELRQLPENSNVIAMKLDRIFRDTVDGLTTLEYWKSQKVKLHLANEGGCSIDTSTATGKLIATFLLGVTSWEPEAIGERTSAAFKTRMADNKNHLNSRSIPYGMRADPNSNVYAESGTAKGVIEDTYEMKVVHLILNLKEDGYGYRPIARQLNDDGILCRGKDWSGQKVKRVVQRYREKDH